jgi:hypothetical protein
VGKFVDAVKWEKQEIRLVGVLAFGVVKRLKRLKKWYVQFECVRSV